MHEKIYHWICISFAMYNLYFISKNLGQNMTLKKGLINQDVLHFKPDFNKPDEFNRT